MEICYKFPKCCLKCLNNVLVTPSLRMTESSTFSRYITHNSFFILPEKIRMSGDDACLRQKPKLSPDNIKVWKRHCLRRTFGKLFLKIECLLSKKLGLKRNLCDRLFLNFQSTLVIKGTVVIVCGC